MKSTDRVDLEYPGGFSESYVKQQRMEYTHRNRFPLISPLRDTYNPILDLVRTVQLIAMDCPDAFGNPNNPLEDGMFQLIERSAKRKDHSSLKDHVQRFNEKVQKIRAEGLYDTESFRSRSLSYDQTVILLDQIYARAVTDPDALRQYRGKISNQCT